MSSNQSIAQVFSQAGGTAKGITAPDPFIGKVITLAVNNDGTLALTGANNSGTVVLNATVQPAEAIAMADWINAIVAPLPAPSNPLTS